MSTYEYYRPKLDKPRYLAEREEARRAYDWFIESIPTRIAMVQAFMKECGYPILEGRDFLPVLNDFYFNTCAEIVGQERLGSLELSLASDINMLVGDMLVRRFENLHWAFNTFNDVAHHSPVIMGFEKVKDKKYNREFFGPLASYGLRIIKGKPKQDDLFFKWYDSCARFA